MNWRKWNNFYFTKWKQKQLSEMIHHRNSLKQLNCICCVRVCMIRALSVPTYLYCQPNRKNLFLHFALYNVKWRGPKRMKDRNKERNQTTHQWTTRKKFTFIDKLADTLVSMFSTHRARFPIGFIYTHTHTNTKQCCASRWLTFFYDASHWFT